MSEAILEKVRKLLAKAEDPGCTPAEAEALTDKAAQLIAKYGVDRALLAAARPEFDPVADRVVEVLAPYALDKSGLLGTIAAALRCRSVRRERWDGDKRSYSVHLFGFSSDLERVELLFTSLLVQAAYGLAAAPVPEWESPAAFRRSWLAGFTFAVGSRISAAEKRAASQVAPANGGPSLALVLADRGHRVERRLTEAYPRLRSAGPRRLRGSGIDRGYAAGQRADLGGSRLGRRTPGSLSSSA
jgi:hypothetical protein